MNVIEVDYIARIAEAWDGRGNMALTPPTEHRALLTLAGLPEALWNRPWSALEGEQRRRLVAATRRILSLGQWVAYVYGAGER